MRRTIVGFKPIKIKPVKMPQIKIKPVRIPSLYSKAPRREPLNAKIKNAVMERSKKGRYRIPHCEYQRCNETKYLEFHHIDMHNSNNKIGNIELLCCKHHADRHAKKFRKTVSKNYLTGEKRTRLVKKKKKTKTKKTKRKRRSNTKRVNLLGW